MRQWVVDAFASQPFRGNPACVVEPFDSWPQDAWMQALAAENNQAETAFLLKGDAPDRFGLRWFTPGTEVPLCGHATLAAAHVLFMELGVEAAAVVFESRHAGELKVSRRGDGLEMDFPADPPHRIETPDGLAEALAVAPLEVWAGQYLIVIVADEATVRGARPDIGRIAALGHEAAGGPGQVVIAAEADPSSAYDVVSRFFAPGCGVPEDPTTGSAHTILAPLFADRLGRPTLKFHQAYPGRGGDMECEVTGGRVLIRGQALTVLDGRLRL